MIDTKIYVTYFDTGDVYDTHGITYVGLDEDKARELLINPERQNYSDYIEVWVDGKRVCTIEKNCEEDE